MSAAAVAALTAYGLGLVFTIMAGISSHTQDFPTPRRTAFTIMALAPVWPVLWPVLILREIGKQ